MRITRSSLLMTTTLLLSSLLSTPGHAAITAPLNELYRTTPAPPKDPDSANAWVKDGKVVAPEILTLESDLQAAAAAALADAAHATAAKTSGGQDSAAVMAAANGYRAYVAANEGPNSPASVLGGRVKWLAGRFNGLKKRVAGTERETEVREQELASYRTLFADWQAQRGPILNKAQAELSAAGDPTAIASGEARASVQRYRAAMLDEIEVLLGLTRFSVERATGLATAETAPTLPNANTLWDLMVDPRKKPAS